MSATPNPFRDPTLRANYEQALVAFLTKDRVLYLPGGVRPQAAGNSFASFFWRGFDGTKIGAGFTDRASKQTLGYAWYRAGQRCARGAK